MAMRMKSFVVFMVYILLSNDVCHCKQSYWKKYANNPILTPGKNGSWDSWEIGTTTICYVSNMKVYHMYYEAGNSISTLQIGHATSKDGIQWTEDPNNPVLRPGPAGNWDDGAVWEPFIIYDEKSSIFKLWYGGERVGHKDFQLGYATSNDSSSFTKYSPNGENGQISFFNSSFANVGDNHVLYIPPNKYYMYFLQRHYRNPYALMVAFGTNETNFDFDHAVNVTLSGDLPARCPDVFVADDIWFMYYAVQMDPNATHKAGRTGYAENPSKDGIHWIAHNTSIVNGQDAFIVPIINDELYYMYYGPNGTMDASGDLVNLAILNGTLEQV